MKLNKLGSARSVLINLSATLAGFALHAADIHNSNGSCITAMGSLN